MILSHKNTRFFRGYYAYTPSLSVGVFQLRNGVRNFKYNLEPECRTTADLALNAYDTSHQFHQLLGNGKPKSGAAIFTCGGGIGLHEFIKNSFLLFFGDADACIGNRAV